jgi:hypothetical protein
MTILDVICSLISVLLLALANLDGYRRGYKQSHKHGYDSGYVAGRNDECAWQILIAEQVKEAQEEIWREEASHGDSMRH